MIRVVESIQSYLKFLKEHLAENAAASVETSHTVAQLAEALPAITRSLADIVDRLDSIDARLNRYIGDQSKQEGRVARLDHHVSEVRKKLGLGA